MQILDRLVALTRVVIRRLVHVGLQSLVRDRDPHVIAEGFEVLQRELLHLVGRVSALEAGTESVTLDGLGQDDRGLTLVVHCGMESGVDLAVIVPTTLEIPNVVIGHVLDHCEGLGVAAKEVLADVGATLGFIGLIIAIGGAVHEIPQGAVIIHRKQGIPFASPDDLDDIPASSAEEALQFLNDFSVAANRTI